MDDGPCVMYVGPGGAGNFVKMVHNGIEYGDMQLISEAYDVLRTVGGLGNDEIADVFVEWNKARAAIPKLIHKPCAVFQDALGHVRLASQALTKDVACFVRLHASQH